MVACVRLTMNSSRVIAFVAIALLSACGSHPGSPTTPSVPPPVPQPAPAPTYQVLNGYSYDTAFRPISGATINLVDGTQAGASTISDATGRFSFAGTFQASTTVRVTKEGYTPATATAKSNGGSTGMVWAFVVLDALARPVDMIGDYTLTIVAWCTGIPEDVRTRTYAASIRNAVDSQTQPGTRLTLAVEGGTFVPDRRGFAVGVSGNDVAFNIYNGEDFGLVEKVGAGTFLAISGSTNVSIANGGSTKISTSFSGAIDYCALQGDTAWTDQCNSGPRTAFEHCESTDHQLVLSRR